MARTFAKILVSIWEDPDFRALDPEAQRVYFLLVSQPDLSPAGVLPYLPRRWARCAAGTEEGDVEKTVRVLAAAEFVVIDDETDELLIRTFVTHDGGLPNPKMRGAVKNALARVLSPALRALIVAQVPEEYRGAIDERSPIVLPPNDRRSTNGRQSNGNPIERGEGVGEGVVGGSPTSSTTRVPPRSKATLIPETFEVTPTMREWVESRCVGVDWRLQTERFVNYWKAKPDNKDAKKADWERTWRNWMLGEFDKLKNGRPIGLAR